MDDNKITTGARSGTAFIFSIIGLIFALLFVFNIFKFTFNFSDLSFASFLNWLGDVKSLTINFSISDFYIHGSWGIIDGLREFLNIFAQLFGVIVYLCANLINMLIYLGQFIGFLFT